MICCFFLKLKAALLDASDLVFGVRSARNNLLNCFVEKNVVLKLNKSLFI